MNLPRIGHSVCYLNGSIYVTGGKNDGESKEKTNLCEKYVIKDK